MTSIPIGRYRHYKGNEYTVLGVARHSETEEELIVYQQEFGDRSLWVRPKPMFLETVEIDGQEVARFQFVGDQDRLPRSQPKPLTKPKMTAIEMGAVHWSEQNARGEAERLNAVPLELARRGNLKIR